jgi:hypothetical protein
VNGPEECDHGPDNGNDGVCTVGCKHAFVCTSSQVVPNPPRDRGNLIVARVVYGLAPAGYRPASAGDRAERPSGAGAEGMLPCPRQTTPTPTRI